MTTPHSPILELPLFQAAKDDSNVQDLVDLLHRDTGWLTAAEILHRLNLPNTEANRRRVRAWAEAAQDEIISGQLGYRHVQRATPEEINHFANWMEAQARKMLDRAIRTRRHAHAILG